MSKDDQHEKASNKPQHLSKTIKKPHYPNPTKQTKKKKKTMEKKKKRQR